MLQDVCDRLAVKWHGPFRVIKKISDIDYVIFIKGEEIVFHITMLKKFYHHDRPDKKTPTIVMIHQQDSPKDNDRRIHLVANSVICKKDIENISSYII